MNDDHTNESPSSDETELARAVETVRQYFKSPGTTDAKELHDHLQPVAPAAIVDVNPGDVEIVVIVERPTESDPAPVEEAYSVRPAASLEGNSTLQWTYLGHVEQ